MFGTEPDGSDARMPDVDEVERRKVAIVEDDYAVRDSLRVLLEVVGHAVETFGSAAEFLKAETQNPSCLIFDHHMPGMTGLELAERLRADGAGIPILLVTDSLSPAIVARAATIGINVIEKPPSEDDLLDFINTTRP